MYDVAIVGAGPTGASAAVFTGRAGLRTALVDADQGMTRRAWLPNHLGFSEGITGQQLVEDGYKHATAAGAELIKAKITAIEKNGENFTLKAEDGSTFDAKQVILGLGANVELAKRLGADVREGTEPRIKEVVAVDGEGHTSIPGVWAAGTCAGTSVHTVITAGDGARVAINLISELKGQRYVDHEVLPADKK